jgi:predicted lipid-binding transport protein (Tim44 family)
MKKTLGLLALILAVGLTTAVDAQAKRLGGGKSSGMQRDSVSAPAPTRGTPSQSPSQQQAAPQNAGAPATAGAAAGAAQKRSWMGPVAGLAAGLGLAALASHFGFGEALANFMMIGLLVMAVLVVVGLVMRRRAAGASPTLAGAGAGASSGAPAGPFGQTIQQRSAAPAGSGGSGGSLIGSRIGSGLAPAAGATAAVGTIPVGFDTEGFARNAKANFMELQSANDAADLGRLREYLTPEMFEAVREEVLERGGEPQSTEVFGLQAQVVDVSQDASGYVVSVRFTGSVRTQAAEIPQDLDEVWHLTKPTQGNGGWIVAGIQQA